MNLKKYNQKRNFSKTTEPKGKNASYHKKLKFVIQHHMAKKDHYDLRLEWNGVLKSWAVPKGPSYNPKDKRLAIHVEDHPYSYRTFEGTIPKGEYGGGTVMIWDEGIWNPEDNFKGNFNKPIKFSLNGKRMHGLWTLIPFKDDNYILIKENDNFSNYIDINKYKISIKSNRTMKEIANDAPKSDKTFIEDIEITHPEKNIFPNYKITKLDVAKYYQQVYPRMRPFLEERLISTIRAPEGINKEIFFKKHFENNQMLVKKIILNSNNKKEDYYYIKDVMGIIEEVQMNGFEFHIWGSKVKKNNQPDIMVFDLDPDEKMPLAKVREGVRDLKSILDELSLMSFLKTSGGKGYHVVVPIKTKYTWMEFKSIAQNVAKLMEVKWPDKYVSNVRKSNRKGKIFIDWIRNTKSSTSVAPYSLRLRPKAPVSMPIFWNELDKITPNSITINDAIKRLKRKDPWENFFDVN